MTITGYEVPSSLCSLNIYSCGNLSAVFSAMVMKDGVVHCNFDLPMTGAFDYRKWDVIF